MSWVDLLDIQTSVEKNVVSSCFHSYLWLMKHTCALSLVFLGRPSWRSTPTFSSLKSQINLIQIEFNQILWWEPIPNLPFAAIDQKLTQFLNDQNPCFFSTHLHGVNLHNPSDMIWTPQESRPHRGVSPFLLCFFFLGDPRFRAWLVPGRKAIHNFWSFNGNFSFLKHLTKKNTSNGPSNLTSTSIQSYPFLKNTDVWYILVTTKNLSWSNLAPVTDTFCDFTIPKRIALQ